MNIAYNVGDVVACKGSSIAMTVERVGKDHLETVWFDAGGKLNRETFDKQMLEMVPLYPPKASDA